MNVLLVDDEASVIRVLGDFLVECGHDVIPAGDGAEALKVLEKRGDIGVIVSDIRMPRMDGITFLRAVRVRFPGTPVILITGHGDEDVAVSALHEGAFDYLKKPVKLNAFMDCIERVEERNRLESRVLEDYRSHLRAGQAGEEMPARATGHRIRVDAAPVSAKILAVDGESGILDLVEEALSNLGFQVQVAATGEAGLERFAEDLWDVVVCETDLPGMDGIELVRHMRELDPAVIPIFTTSRHDKETIVRALECGARSYLMKPFTLDELRLRIEKALRERQQIVDTRLLLGDLIQGRSDLQQKIAVREGYLRHLIDAAPFGVLSTDREGGILTFNGEAERMYGYASREIAGKPVSRLFGGVTAEDGEPDPGDPAWQVKATHVRKDGGAFPVLMRRRGILDNRRRCIAHLYVVEDLSEREWMEKQLLYAERLSLLGQLAPRVAHEFKTPLQVIAGNAQLALLEMDGDSREQARSYLEHIPPAVTQLLDLIHQMANLGKPSESRQEEMDLQVEVEKVIDTLSSLGVVKYCEIVRDYGAPLPKIEGDPSQIEQVFRNLIVNAAQAMDDLDRRELRLSLKASSDGERVEASVGDTGPGIPEENRGRIFEPFFTTKREGEGTGLGLPIVKTILDRQNATIAVESEVGEGTVFTLSFPASRPLICETRA